MTALIKYLESFNRKERFYLIGMALGNTRFQLSDEFRGRLGQALKVSVPPEAFAAMDYHLDWIYASLYLAAHGGRDKVHKRKGRTLTATQEDVDLLVAYQEVSMAHLILVEAKGDLAWSNDQMRSKARRLGAIFGKIGKKWDGVTPHLVLASPRRPEKLATERWPSWMQEYAYVKLAFPANLLRVVRCDSNLRPSASDEYWRVETS